MVPSETGLAYQSVKILVKIVFVDLTLSLTVYTLSTFQISRSETILTAPRLVLM